jgi:hypothetical protein
MKNFKSIRCFHPPWYRHLYDWQNVLFDNSRADIPACSKLKSKFFYFENQSGFFNSINLSLNAWIANFRPLSKHGNSFISSMIASAAGMRFFLFSKVSSC